MSRTRPLRVLFVRPDDRAGLSSLFGFSIPRERADVLPVPLLELATAVLLGSRHRAFVHDARRDPGGNRAVRSVAAVHKAHVAVIQFHPALLADGLEAARAARHGGATLVLAAGPLVTLWPDAVRGAPEIDGLVTSPSGLLAALEATGESAEAFQAALNRDEPLPPAARGIDRKLLDYAAYRGLPGGAALPGLRVDKGRHAASPILLHAGGALRSTEDLRRELDVCALLGIPRRAFVATEGAPRPDTRTWIELLRGRTDGGRYRLPLADGASDEQVAALLRAGVQTLDVGPRAADPAELGALAPHARAWRAAGARVALDLVFGLRSLDEEERALSVARTLGADVHVQLRVPLPPTAEGRPGWDAWLGAPRADFHPPVPDGERRIELAERARVLLSAQPRSSGLTGLIARLTGS